MCKPFNNYNSEEPTKCQWEFYWSQASPSSYSPDNPQKRDYIWKGKGWSPTKHWDWRSCHEERNNMAGYWARTLHFRLGEAKSEQPEALIIKGSINLGEDATVETWRLFKEKVGRRITYFNKKHGHLAFAAIQHITFAKSYDKMHMDFVGFVVLNDDWSKTQFKKRLGKWLRDCGAETGTGSGTHLKFVEDTSSESLWELTKYTVKYDPELKAPNVPLAASNGLPMTWVVGNFWNRATAEFEITEIVDGRTETHLKELRPQQQVWRDFCKKTFGDEPVRRSTYKARQHAHLEKSAIQCMVREKYLQKPPLKIDITLSTVGDYWNFRYSPPRELYYVYLTDECGIETAALRWWFDKHDIRELIERMCLEEMPGNVRKTQDGLKKCDWRDPEYVQPIIFANGNPWKLAV